MIKNPTGLHLRPAGILCKVAMGFNSKITFQIKGDVYNTKSVLSILGACVKSGDELLFVFNGEDEENAMEKITHAIEQGLVE